MSNVYNSQYWRTHGGVLPGWIVGTAGAARHPLLPDASQADQALFKPGGSRPMRYILAITIVLLVSAGTAHAGNGSFTVSNGQTVNLTCFFDYNETAFGVWQNQFLRSNALMWAATNGQLRFGRIQFVTDPSARQRADAIFGQKGSAYVSGDRKGTNLGTTDQLFFYKNEIGEDMVVVHELGHYLFGLWDEYKGQKFTLQDGRYMAVGASNDTYCVISLAKAQQDGNPSGASIMYDNNNPTLFKTFCISANHQTANQVDKSTQLISVQQVQEGRSCWDSIAAYTPLVAPTAAYNVETLPPSNPTFRTLNNNALVLYLIQNSQGVDLTTGLAAAARGANRVRLPGGARTVGDAIGVMSFTDDATSVHGIANMTSKLLPDAVQAINGITASEESATNIEQSLRTAMAAMVSSDSSAAYATKTIVLITNGNATSGSLDANLIEALRANDIVVNVVALPNAASAASLQTLASQTLGSFEALSASAARFLPQAPPDAAAEDAASNDAIGEYTIARASGTVGAGARQTQTMTVDASSTDAAFELLFPTSATLSLALIDPNGRAISLSNPPANVSVQTEAGSVFVRIDGALAGTYGVTVDGTAAVSSTAYTLSLFGSGQRMAFSLPSDEEEVTFPQAPLIQVQVGTDQAVIGASVTARVTRPDGSVVPLTLFDDGNEAFHGDALAADGLYSNYFTAFNGPGAYDVEITVVNSNGQFTTNGVKIEAPASVTGPAPPFQRIVELTLEADNVPSGGGTAWLPPGNVQVFALMAGQAIIDWTDTNAGQSGFTVQRSVGGATSFANVASLAPGVTEYVDTAAPDALVYYQLIATSNQGNSAPSDFQPIDMAAAAQALSSAPTPQPNASSGGGFPPIGPGGNSGGGGACFIATAAYGSYLDAHVASLRRFRDEVLMPTSAGRRFVAFYYRHSPPLANYLAAHRWARVPVRWALTPMVLAIEYPFIMFLIGMMFGMFALRIRRRMG